MKQPLRTFVLLAFGASAYTTETPARSSPQPPSARAQYGPRALRERVHDRAFPEVAGRATRPAPGPWTPPAAHDPMLSKDPSAGSSGLNTPYTSAAAGLCTGSVMDKGVPGACIQASSVPTLGMLLPLGPEFDVDADGHVGIGTPTPAYALDRVGDPRSSARARKVSRCSASTPYSTVASGLRRR